MQSSVLANLLVGLGTLQLMHTSSSTWFVVPKSRGGSAMYFWCIFDLTREGQWKLGGWEALPPQIEHIIIVTFKCVYDSSVFLKWSQYKISIKPLFLFVNFIYVAVKWTKIVKWTEADWFKLMEYNIIQYMSCISTLSFRGIPYTNNISIVSVPIAGY